MSASQFFRTRNMIPLFATLGLVIGCSKSNPISTSNSAPTTPSSVSVIPIATASTAGTGAAPKPPVNANVPSDSVQGTATLVVQRVYADCATGGWAGTGEKAHLLGTDIFVSLQSDDAKAKPEKEFATCPSHKSDGSAQKPTLQLWGNCSAFPSCQVLSNDASADGKVEVQCGKEHFVVESDGHHTVLRGAFGERELAPHPMKVAPVKSEVRHAMVDC